MTAAIIAARGGSKRLPRKNVREFCGIPLVAWAIIQAKCSHLIDEVYVTTDDDEIEEIATRFGAAVIRRPIWPDADKAAANRPFIHAITMLSNNYPLFDTVVCMLPTMPLNLPGDLDRGIRMFREMGVDCVIPCRPLREMIARKKINSYLFRTEIFAKGYQYVGEGGGWNICKPAWYIKFNSEMSDLDADLDVLGDKGSLEGYYLPVEYWQYADVDTIEEFEFGELIMNHYILKDNGAKCYFDYAEGRNNTDDPLNGIDLSRYAGNLRQQ